MSFATSRLGIRFPDSQHVLPQRLLAGLLCFVIAASLASRPALGQLAPVRGTVAAPPLSGAGEWMNTAQPLELAALRGKFVVLDFWTYCCINCMHILPELKKLEQKYADSLVVIGVHSAKFATEREAENIRQAILRYEHRSSRGE